MLGYAVIIRRSQGITLEEAKVAIGHNEFQVGLMYVALFCVKKIEQFFIKTSI